LPQDHSPIVMGRPWSLRRDRREFWRRRGGRSEQEVSVDESALRACNETPFRARQLPYEVPHDALRQDSSALHRAHPEKSFFLSWPEAKALLATEERPALLGYVAEVLDHYLRTLRSKGLRRARCGAEFWVQQRSAGQGINFHWDKDEALRDAAEVVIHPAVSTITYLSTGGAPTVVLDVRTDGGALPEGGAEVSIGSERRPVQLGGKPARVSALVSWPREGKLLAFSGALLHGVPAQLADPRGSSERLTLLVNIWVHHRPLGVRKLPRKTLQHKLRRTTRGYTLSGSGSGAAEAPPTSLPPPTASMLHELEVPVCGTHLLRVQLDHSRRVSEEARASGGPGRGTLRCSGVPLLAEALPDEEGAAAAAP